MIEFVYSQVPGSLVTVLLLLLAHLTLWDRVGRLWRVTAYAIGCSCIAVGMGVSALITRDATALQAYLLHLAPGGLVILLAWSARGWQAARDQARQDAAIIEEQARHAERTY